MIDWVKTELLIISDAYQKESDQDWTKFYAHRLKPFLDMMGYKLSEERIEYVLKTLHEVAIAQGEKDWAKFFAFWFDHYGIKEGN